ncbi:hypothetical protein Q4574_14685 [Aliiglaciecola sp. 3_MG-2023]|uniref:hypothetical protein n=1 Tax=Aliiglaciecola sp. 3_MG-2023 TaxID=3062644 RepID=UPI0026E38902|nr:hypothetical protein [Aliiglaciecola sp. 3_MG-2023]MDO6694540.1 hypothetical protein [Aliiglaciecola sp. 3_MG-2023]
MSTLNKEIQEQWLTSKQMREHLNVSGCELMHLRQAGKLVFKKVGNAFYYSKVKTLANENI